MAKQALIPTPEVLARSHLAASTLNYWVDEGVVRATVRGAGQRYVRYWTVNEAVAVRAVKQLRDAGCPMTTVRTVATLVETGSSDPTHTLLRWNGLDVDWASEDAVTRVPVPRASKSTIAVFIPIRDWQDDAHADVVWIDPAKLQASRVLRRRGRARRAPLEVH
jgi:DNA-binding transcriptional MerR regulator